VYGEVRTIRVEESRIRDAAEKKGHAEKRIRSLGEEPEASDRNWIE